ncbi:endonuclease III [Campylobacter sp. RM9344]|uniref:Endonuclease III n=1 Tax=Campylobacter californiensis TaxID=1032243 RepID=A0AAW3ZUF0_9BACT|nr:MULTISPECIES: endonuclease III [unclassified Campylobacter]MBE2985099.1 endonuclease III [Campylobacter sp. RM6883]MBE2986568.1 endonuclease III [Campylobacter sp. RM12919]MBE2987637.1 endonuclease III [Campylobacter sp. RM12920]MBE2995576.1 endonuclease III [Campylobacter sp. RM6913]MBE3029262.1 endonuclease III [Campylobacter sp. RM9344]
MRTKKDISKIKNLFLQNYKDAKSELQWKNNYELIVCVMLSAQCTDKRVNLITPAFFEAYPDVNSLSNANLASVKLFINSCSFFNNKAQNLIKMAKSVVDDHGGEIPLTESELINLAGVGTKTAHVVMLEALGANVMAVDTHVFRVSHRLGLSSAKTPQATEADLILAFKTDLGRLHQAMVLFGRYVCKAQKPLCGECFLYELCKSKDKVQI